MTGPEKKERLHQLRALIEELCFELERALKEYRDLEKTKGTKNDN